MAVEGGGGGGGAVGAYLPPKSAPEDLQKFVIFIGY